MIEQTKSRTASTWINSLRCQVLAFLCTVGFLIPASGQATDSAIAISWSQDQAGADSDWFAIRGLSEAALSNIAQASFTSAEWQRLFNVTVEQPTLDLAIEQPSVIGRYQLLENEIRFYPRFPLSPGTRYRVTFLANALKGEVGESLETTSRVFEVPNPAPPEATRVVTIYPTADVLPENLLKFYVHFSAPMSGRQVHRFIRLVNAENGPVELPFLELDDALWNIDMTQLTLFIDPGRIKREVKPLEEVGPSLSTGESYQLEIDKRWPDATGHPLANTFIKEFSVDEPDRNSPDLDSWQLTPPTAGTREALVVQFGESMDQALAQRMIRVATRSGDEVRGIVSLSQNESEWTFVPDAKWESGRYELVVQTTIEDLAGNNIGKLFEVDLRRETGLQPLPRFARRTFLIE